MQDELSLEGLGLQTVEKEIIKCLLPYGSFIKYTHTPINKADDNKAKIILSTFSFEYYNDIFIDKILDLGKCLGEYIKVVSIFQHPEINQTVTTNMGSFIYNFQGRTLPKNIDITIEYDLMNTETIIFLLKLYK